MGVRLRAVSLVGLACLLSTPALADDPNCVRDRFKRCVKLVEPRKAPARQVIRVRINNEPAIQQVTLTQADKPDVMLEQMSDGAWQATNPVASGRYLLTVTPKPESFRTATRQSIDIKPNETQEFLLSLDAKALISFGLDDSAVIRAFEVLGEPAPDAQLSVDGVRDIAIPAPKRRNSDVAEQEWVTRPFEPGQTYSLRLVREGFDVQELPKITPAPNEVRSLSFGFQPARIRVHSDVEVVVQVTRHQQGVGCLSPKGLAIPITREESGKDEILVPHGEYCVIATPKRPALPDADVGLRKVELVRVGREPVKPLEFKFIERAKPAGNAPPYEDVLKQCQGSLQETLLGPNPGACVEAGHLLRRGVGVGSDELRAATYYIKACQQGDTEGCDSAGWMYATGSGVGQSRRQARWYYEAACREGYVPSCLRLMATSESAERFHEPGDKYEGHVRISRDLTPKDGGIDLEAAYGTQKLALVQAGLTAYFTGYDDFRKYMYLRFPFLGVAWAPVSDGLSTPEEGELFLLGGMALGLRSSASRVPYLSLELQASDMWDFDIDHPGIFAFEFRAGGGARVGTWAFEVGVRSKLVPSRRARLEDKKTLYTDYTRVFLVYFAMDLPLVLTF